MYDDKLNKLLKMADKDDVGVFFGNIPEKLKGYTTSTCRIL